MAQVTVRINGYTYTVGCEDGQEHHLQAMARQVEERIDSIKALGGQSGEARLLVLAALLMADELHDLRSDLAEARAQAERLGRKAARSEGRGERELAQRLERLASRAEEIAATLDHP